MSANESQVCKQFALNLRHQRTAHTLTQEDLSFRAGLHRTQISLLESGNRLPRLITFIKLRGALGICADALLLGIDFEPYVVQPGGIQVTGPTVDEP